MTLRRVLGTITVASLVVALGLATLANAYEPDPNAARESVPADYLWSLAQLFESEDAWRAEMKAVEHQIQELAALDLADPDTHDLAQALELYFDTHNRANHCTLYANLLRSVRLDDDDVASMETKSLALMDEVMEQATEVRKAILSFDDATLEGAYRENDALARSRNYLQNIRRRAGRVLDEEAERVLGLMGDNLWAEIDLNEIPSSLESTFGALLTDISWPVITDENGEQVQMTLSSYPRYRASDDAGGAADAGERP